MCLTPKLTGAGARSAQGTAMGHKNGEAMAHGGVRVERTVRLRRVVEGFGAAHTCALLQLLDHARSALPFLFGLSLTPSYDSLFGTDKTS